MDAKSGKLAGRQAGKQVSHPRRLFRVIKSTELFSGLSGLNLKRGRETKRKRERKDERRKGGRWAKRTTVVARLGEGGGGDGDSDGDGNSDGDGDGSSGDRRTRTRRCRGKCRPTREERRGSGGGN